MAAMAMEAMAMAAMAMVMAVILTVMTVAIIQLIVIVTTKAWSRILLCCTPCPLWLVDTPWSSSAAIED